MIAEDRPRLGADVDRDGATARPGPRRWCRRPSTNRRRRSPGCSRRPPPTARPTRSAGARSCRPVGSRARRATSGSAAMASSRPASSVVRGTIESTSRYSAGRVVVAADRAQPVEAGDAEPGGRVGVGRAAGRASATSKPSACATRLGVLDQAAAALELLHRPPARHRLELDGHVGDLGGLGDRADLRLGGLERVARPSPGRRPRACSVSATTLGRVPPTMTPTLTVTPGQRPLRSCRSRTMPGRLEDRAAALLGLDAGVRGPAVDGDAQVEDALARRDDVAVRPGAFEHQRDVRRRRRAPRCAASRSASRSPRRGWR